MARAQRCFESALESARDVWANSACAASRSRLELFYPAQWLNQFDGPALVRGSHEFVRPSRIPRVLHTVGCDRSNYEWFHFRYRDRTGACLAHFLMCGPASD